jgi:ADP-L-glycero-D-manno-heptose 6-epimerase
MRQYTHVVTGAAGFIGRNVVEALNARGDTRLLLVDELGRSEKWKNLVGLRYEDIWHPSRFRQAFRDNTLPDGILSVIHLGACSATTETDADYLLDNNYAYTRELCQWCLDQGVRFVYASSAATYGDGALGYSDDDDKTPLYRPLNMYGYSKHMFDLWALENNLFARIAGLKYFNVYGPYEDHKDDMRSVVHKSHQQIRAGGNVKLFRSHRPDYRDGEQLRDFIYVKDAVAVTLWLADRVRPSGLFNCGTGEARSWLDLARAVYAALGRVPEIEFIDMPATLQPKYQYYTKADMGKLRAAGYDRPFTSLEDGVRDYVRGYLGV